MKFNEQYTVENYIIEFLSGVNPSGFNKKEMDSRLRGNDKGGGNDKGDCRAPLRSARNDRCGLGYEYIKPQEFAILRQFESEFLIISQLLKVVMKINKINEEEAQNVVREIKKVDNNEDFLKLMRSGINLVDQKTRHKRDYKVVDFKNIENNLSLRNFNI